MTVVVLDTRNIIDAADALTNWNFSVNNNSRALFTADPDPIEATQHIGIAVSTATEEGYFDGTIPNSGDLSNTLLYIWGLSQGIMDTEVNGGVQIVLGDGTNRRGYHVGGSNVSSFRHPTDNPNYECHVLDTSNLPTATTNFQGAGAPTLTTITEVGLAFKTLQNAKGGTENCFIDIMRFGTDGIELTSQILGQIIRFDSAAASDRSGLTARASGAVREIGDGVFSAQSKITFGTLGDIVGRDCDFLTKDETFLWESRGLSTATRYGFEVRKSGGASPGRASFIAGNRVSQGVGNQGSTFIANSASNAKANFIASQNTLDSVGIYGCVFRDWEEFVFRGDDSAAVDTEIFQTDFIQCGNVDLGRIEARNCGFFSTKATGTTTAAATFNDTTNMSGLFFSSGGTGHGINIDSATANQEFTFSNFTYSGYAATTGNTGNEALINLSGEPITVLVSGGDVPTVDSDGVRGQVTVVNNITVSVSGIDGASEVRVLQNPSPYTATSLPAPAVVVLASTERVSADIIEGDGTNYFQYTNNNGKLRLNAVGTATFDGVLNNGDTISNAPNGSALTDGDTVCVFIRDDDDNPTLQLEDDGLVVATGGTGQTAPTASTIDTDTDFATFTSQFGTTLNSANSKTVSVERKEAVYEFAVPINTVIDFLVFKIGDEPVLVTEQTITDTNKSFPISQVGDRTYRNPA